MTIKYQKIWGIIRDVSKGRSIKQSQLKDIQKSSQLTYPSWSKLYQRERRTARCIYPLYKGPRSWKHWKECRTTFMKAVNQRGLQSTPCLQDRWESTPLGAIEARTSLSNTSRVWIPAIFAWVLPSVTWLIGNRSGKTKTSSFLSLVAASTCSSRIQLARMSNSTVAYSLLSPSSQRDTFSSWIINTCMCYTRCLWACISYFYQLLQQTDFCSPKLPLNPRPDLHAAQIDQRLTVFQVILCNTLDIQTNIEDR